LIRPLSIVFEDPFCLAVVKPAGQFTQGTWAPPGEETLEQAIRRHLNPDDPARAYVGIVHRLDRPVSGLLLWAKTRKAARRLSKQFEARQVIKEYWAIVESPGAEAMGPFLGTANDSVTWEDWLTRAGPDGRVRAVESNTPNSRLARTTVCCLASPHPIGNLTRLQLWPATGRTHQLRVQTATRGMPILGDSIYGSVQDFPNGIALHARGLKIRHPDDQTEMILQAPAPDSWIDYGLKDVDTD
jgi:23S rRNA pseudouridine1911/1915/1917 synthase